MLNEYLDFERFEDELTKVSSKGFNVIDFFFFFSFFQQKTMPIVLGEPL